MGSSGSHELQAHGLGLQFISTREGVGLWNVPVYSIMHVSLLFRPIGTAMSFLHADGEYSVQTELTD